MSVDIKEKSWYMKYQPTSLDGLVFDSENHRSLMEQWMNDEYISGNILFYGPPGLGKTTSAEILIHKIIKAQNDIYICRDLSTKEMKEEVKPFVTKRPVKSKRKIVYIEEADKLHPDALNVLKNQTMEKYQDIVSFIMCTNYIGKLAQKDAAILSRLTHKISFSGKNIEGITNRIKHILTEEKSVFDESKLQEYIKKNLKSGIREIINTLQIAHLTGNGTIDFDNIGGYVGLEENIIQTIIEIIRSVGALNARDKKLCIINPINSPISEKYQTLSQILHNNYDINFNVIFDRLLDASQFVPLKLIIGKYADANEFKKYPHLNILGCLKEMIECMINIMG